MRYAFTAFALFASAGALAADPPPAPAPAGPAATPICDGDIWIIRKSQIIPGGSLIGFVKAFNDQAAWYRANGAPYGDQKIGHVLRYNPQARERAAVEDQIVTIAIQPKADNLPRRNAEWKAFSAEYKANSRILEELQVCVTAKS